MLHLQKVVSEHHDLFVELEYYSPSPQFDHVKICLNFLAADFGSERDTFQEFLLVLERLVDKK